MPDWRSEVRRRLARARLSPAREAEVVEELAQHVQDRYEELRAAGKDEAAARAIALDECEGEDEGWPAEPLPPTPIGLSTRGATMRGMLWQDVRYALRTCRKAPGFSSVVILTLALGIGATTAIFSVVDGVLLRPFPYADIERIMILGETTRAGQGLSVAWQNYGDWREQNDVFESIGVYRGMTVNLTGGVQAERLNASLVSSGVFAAVGIAAQSGRAFLAEDDRPTAERVVVVSDRLWRGRFNADPALVGRTILLNNQAHLVVGIAPPGMRFPSRLTDVWLPVGLFVSTFPPDRGAHPGLSVVAKLKRGVSVEQARSNMDAIARRLEQQYPMSNVDHTVTVTPYYEQIVRNIRPALTTLTIAAALLLLIGCANLANLMLAKSDGRQREMGIRAALGAARGRIFQQLLIESLLMALAGGALGALLAALGVRAFVASQPTSVPRIDLIAVDRRVLAFTTLVSVATGMAFGLAPAWRASSVDLLTAMKESARSTIGAAGRRFQSVLVVVEVALALVLLVGAGLMMKSFGRLMAIDLGFNPAHVVTMRVNLPAADYRELPKWIGFHEEMLRRVRALPGLEAAGLNSAVPLEGGGSESEVRYEGQPLPTSVHEEGVTCLFQASTPDYFRAMGIAFVKGRSFTDRDAASATPVAVVDDWLVAKFFPNADPIGKRIAFEFRGGHGSKDVQPIWREIVGVVRHVHHYGLVGEPPNLQVYAPLEQFPIWFYERRPAMALVVRTSVTPEGLVAAIRREVAAVDRNVPVFGVQTMDVALAQTTEQSRISMTLLGVFSALALLLATLGIYGVLSYLVSRRTQEIGIRLALGATSGAVLRTVVGYGMTLAAAGAVVGVAASWGLAQSMRALLFDLSPHDPATYIWMVAAIAAVALVASYLPARRATRVDPLVALRAE
jgi:putative ABC transport system permease protein